jgi:hypothetical protein
VQVAHLAIGPAQPHPVGVGAGLVQRRPKTARLAVLGQVQLRDLAVGRRRRARWRHRQAEDAVHLIVPAPLHRDRVALEDAGVAERLQQRHPLLQVGDRAPQRDGVVIGPQLQQPRPPPASSSTRRRPAAPPAAFAPPGRGFGARQFGGCHTGHRIGKGLRAPGHVAVGVDQRQRRPGGGQRRQRGGAAMSPASGNGHGGGVCGLVNTVAPTVARGGRAARRGASPVS